MCGLLENNSFIKIKVLPILLLDVSTAARPTRLIWAVEVDNVEVVKVSQLHVVIVANKTQFLSNPEVTNPSYVGIVSNPIGSNSLGREKKSAPIKGAFLLWTRGELDPFLIHAMDAFYR